MGYKKAADILSSELILAIQEYIDEEYIYTPRKRCNRKSCGELTGSKKLIFYPNASSKWEIGIAACLDKFF
ncbi:hypothetical protein [Clostridium sp. BJN0013]|uniref:hypothetical protein n=1 Tax=Clostridium sp. BJN0013 TaxID=3236840 RepID=UPI0034C5E790